jgi:hypothetical protein
MEGLYRHYSGSYFYLTDITTDEEGKKYAHCFNVLLPEAGTVVIPLEKWDEVVEVNNTKRMRFKRVAYIEPTLKDLSTEDLIKELRSRKDSPLQQLDIEGYNSKVFSTDYVVGELYEESEESAKGVFTVATFNTLEEAHAYMDNHASVNTKVFKRTFLLI